MTEKMTLKLGQLFILRRDLKSDIETNSRKISSLLSYREDSEPVLGFQEALEELVKQRQTLRYYDLIIDKANSTPDTVVVGDASMSLLHARRCKVLISDELAFFGNLLANTEMCAKRQETDVETVVENGIRQQITKKVKYVVVPNIPELKARITQLKDFVRLLDSAIQTVDWSFDVEV